MATRIYHYYNGPNPYTEKVMCGSTYASRVFKTTEPTMVTCSKCKAGLRKRGLLPRLPVPDMAQDIAESQRRPAPRPTVAPRPPARPDPENVDDFNNSLLRLGIIG